MFYHCYIHGSFSAVTLSGGTVQFRGLLVQARTVADGSPVGSFTADDAGVTRLSSCDRRDVCFLILGPEILKI